MKLFTFFCTLLFSFTFVFAQNPSVRIKDVGKIIEYRDNQLMGYGLVVGLRNTGDSRATSITRDSLTTLLSKLGISTSPGNLSSRNVASVMVTADLAPFIKPGQRISVTVSALGDSSSLAGGTLLMTPLKKLALVVVTLLMFFLHIFILITAAEL